MSRTQTRSLGLYNKLGCNNVRFSCNEKIDHLEQKFQYTIITVVLHKMTLVIKHPVYRVRAPCVHSPTGFTQTMCKHIQHGYYSENMRIHTSKRRHTVTLQTLHLFSHTFIMYVCQRKLLSLLLPLLNMIVLPHHLETITVRRSGRFHRANFYAFVSMDNS